MLVHYFADSFLKYEGSYREFDADMTILKYKMFSVLYFSFNISPVQGALRLMSLSASNYFYICLHILLLKICIFLGLTAHKAVDRWRLLKNVTKELPSLNNYYAIQISVPNI